MNGQELTQKHRVRRAEHLWRMIRVRAPRNSSRESLSTQWNVPLSYATPPVEDPVVFERNSKSRFRMLSLFLLGVALNRIVSFVPRSARSSGFQYPTSLDNQWVLLVFLQNRFSKLRTDTASMRAFC